MPVTVRVPPRYVRLVRRKAAERNRSFEENSAWDNHDRTWGVDPEERNVIGLMGEMAFAEYADLSIDSSTVTWSDGGQDFHVRLDGESVGVDVKTAQKEPKALMVKEYAVNADYYVLGHVEENEVTFYGGASRERVLNGKRMESRQFDHTNYTIGVDYLDPLPEPDAIEPV